MIEKLFLIVGVLWLVQQVVVLIFLSVSRDGRLGVYVPKLWTQFIMVLFVSAMTIFLENPVITKIWCATAALVLVMILLVLWEKDKLRSAMRQ